MARFIIGTGRCGSTLLSRMLRHHPQVLELSEFFVGLDWSKRFAAEPISGAAFRDLLSQPHPFLSLVLARGYRPPEVTYPFERPGARYAPSDPVPWIAAVALPPLADDPDALFDEVCSFLAMQPARRPAAQAALLFEWLGLRTGREAWIERSAGSLVYLADLAREFPRARFLHIHRAGEASALSMREHPVFRLAVMLTYGLAMGEGGETAELARLGADADHVTQLLASRPRAVHFGRWWSEQIELGMRTVRELPEGHYQALRFEDLLASPAAVLGEIERFFALPDAGGEWKERGAALAEKRDASAPSTLSPAERDELAAACLAGNRLLGRA